MLIHCLKFKFVIPDSNPGGRYYFIPFKMRRAKHTQGEKHAWVRSPRKSRLPHPTRALLGWVSQALCDVGIALYVHLG